MFFFLPQQTTGVAEHCGARAGWSLHLIIQLSTTTMLTAPGRCWPSRETPSPWCSPTFSWRTTMICWRSAARRDPRSGEWSARSKTWANEGKGIFSSTSYLFVGNLWFVVRYPNPKKAVYQFSWNSRWLLLIPFVFTFCHKARTPIGSLHDMSPKRILLNKA